MLFASAVQTYPVGCISCTRNWHHTWVNVPWLWWFSRVWDGLVNRIYPAHHNAPDRSSRPPGQTGDLLCSEDVQGVTVMKNHINSLWLCCLFIALSGCAPEADQTNQAEGGGIAVRAIWPSPAEWQSLSTRRWTARSELPVEAKTVRA